MAAASSPADNRSYDVVVFGATGFTGRLACEYLARRREQPALRWAIAGRNEAKLHEVRRVLEGIDPACANVGTIEARADDPGSLERMAKQTRVVLTTVGPYAEHGEPVVEACIRGGADYVDITGEPEFVDAMIARHHDAAEKARVRIVSCCGFDSIPHDLGARFTVQQLPSTQPITVEGFVRARGGMSGGTWHSAIGAMSRITKTLRQPKGPRAALPDGRQVHSVKPSIRWDRRLEAWVAPLPTIDPQVVLRSARALPEYGPDFRYGHYAQVRSGVTLAASVIGIGALVVLAQLPPTRNLLLKARSQGDGPSVEQRAKGWFEVTFIGKSGSTEVRTMVSGGDPGYAETAKMVSESALCLALDRDVLPRRFGVITTAMAMGDALQKRLQRAGIRFDAIEGAPRSRRGASIHPS
ncbi:MAG: saccharopine dehydrogenase NADP-binding domain-containing protein [Polyangiales bacterium]